MYNFFFSVDYTVLNIVAKWPGSTHDATILSESGLQHIFEGCYMPDSCHLLWDSRVEGTELIDFFMYPFPEELINEIVHNTNPYALQKGKENLALTKEELKKFLGIMVAPSGPDGDPRSRMYWSSEEGLSNARPVNRFEQILRYIHFPDNYSQEAGNADKLFKIKPVLDVLEKIFHSTSDPEEFKSIDEQIILFKRHVSLKQYIPRKPKPCTDLKYIHPWFQTRDLFWKGLTVFQSHTPQLHYGIFYQFFYTIPLIQTLQQQGIYEKVSWLQRETKRRGICSVFSDLHGLFLLRPITNRFVPAMERERGKKMLNIQKPFSVNLYNQKMGGADLMDQCIAMYPHRHKSKWWYIQVLFLTQCYSTSFEAQSPGNHWAQLTKVKNANRCHNAECKRKTKNICMQCFLPLCPGCFASFHIR
uniref:PiggyBac transposable element-derived protein domain-containing protein n=1 Tax=Monopterus albus TaxID=43700 RepID=A0A3Q3IAY3_MONAL